MASNDHTNPALARQAQDIDMPVGIAREPENHFRFGRGGAANVAQLSQDEIVGAKTRNEMRRKSTTEGVVGQFGKEEREREKIGAGIEKEDKPKKEQKTAMGKGIDKLIRTMSKGP